MEEQSQEDEKEESEDISRIQGSIDGQIRDTNERVYTLETKLKTQKDMLEALEIRERQALYALPSLPYSKPGKDGKNVVGLLLILISPIFDTFLLGDIKSLKE